MCNICHWWQKSCRQPFVCPPTLPSKHPLRCYGRKAINRPSPALLCGQWLWMAVLPGCKNCHLVVSIQARSLRFRNRVDAGGRLGIERGQTKYLPSPQSQCRCHRGTQSCQNRSPCRSRNGTWGEAQGLDLSIADVVTHEDRGGEATTAKCHRDLLLFISQNSAFEGGETASIPSITLLQARCSAP
ncbi:hypothetical protein P154DRAFT_267480 [Amniculicola lignicola CBS 123094]|uniref:Uncharacterized protein n=1 Tax=Amniculicola lignicola CBS 123094 TaxID=1392246 RepID=A0A6A5WFV7_9PLEO|nr:hypothetical protein P154DRAFT_267480 [Amniculicola lignicola CBS 123094]